VKCWRGGRRFKVKGQRLKVKGQRLKVKGHRLKVKGQRLKAKGSGFSPVSGKKAAGQVEKETLKKRITNPPG
jgi:hypothetical protein